MSNHTPAPWRVDHGSMLKGVNVITPRNEWICYLGVASRWDVLADANLIAAAPELLEAIEGILGPALLGTQSRDEIVRDWGELGMSQITRARAAIAKARGAA
jgi:hypothetical protein